MPELLEKPKLNTARAVFSQMRKDCAGARGSTWGYLLLAFLVIIAAAILVFVLAHGFLTGSEEQVQHGMDTVWQVYGLLAAPFVAGVSWVCVQHLRSKSVGAWTAFKHASSHYSRLLSYKIVTASFMWVFSLLALSLQHAFMTPTGVSVAGKTLIAVLGVITFVALLVCMTFWMYVYPLILEAKQPVVDAMRRSWRCVQEHQQFWLVVRVWLALILCVLVALSVSLGIPLWLASLGHATLFFKMLGVGLSAGVIVWTYPYLVMLQNTLYCRFFTSDGNMIPVESNDS